jgi:hypothetical protein
MGLATVVRESVTMGAVVPLHDFLRATESVYRRRDRPGWRDLPWRIVAWGLDQVGLAEGWGGGESATATAFGRYVVMGNVEVWPLCRLNPPRMAGRITMLTGGAPGSCQTGVEASGGPTDLFN